MAKTKLSAVLSKDDTGMNGLDEGAQPLVRFPKRPIRVVGMVINAATNIDHKRGVQTPTAEFNHIEVVTDPADIRRIDEILERIYRRRIGQDPDQLDLRTASGFHPSGGDPEEGDDDE